MKPMMLIFLFFLFSNTYASEFHIAVASNFSAPMEVLMKVFSEKTGHKVLTSYGSTAKLYAQILNDAPFEVFLSADKTHALKLIEEKRAIEKTKYTYAVGKIILWSPTAGAIDPNGEILSKKNFKHLSLANPKLAPYGEAARQVLEKKNLWKALDQKIILGESIAQAFQFVSSGNAELGFVAYSQIIKDGKTQGSYWMIPQTLYSPLYQEAVLLKKGEHSVAAKEFLSFLQSEKAKTIIKKFGYEMK
ncbi:MAG: molybdate ABC transporter substrate-binding protein [Bacteriovoracaceae bacterium]